MSNEQTKQPSFEEAIKATMANLPEHLKHIKDDIGDYLAMSLQHCLDAQGFVSRDVFEAEVAVLRRCQQQCKALAERLDALEAKKS